MYVQVLGTRSNMYLVSTNHNTRRHLFFFSQSHCSASSLSSLLSNHKCKRLCKVVGSNSLQMFGVFFYIVFANLTSILICMSVYDIKCNIGHLFLLKYFLNSEKSLCVYVHEKTKQFSIKHYILCFFFVLFLVFFFSQPLQTYQIRTTVAI